MTDDTGRSTSKRLTTIVLAAALAVGVTLAFAGVGAADGLDDQPTVDDEVDLAAESPDSACPTVQGIYQLCQGDLAGFADWFVEHVLG